MKILTLAIVTAVFTIGNTTAATSSKMVDEMEDYARDLIREHPEVAGDKKKKQAREDMVNEAGRSRVFEVTEAEEKNLRRRKDVVTDGEYKSTLEKFKSLNSKDPKVTFLIKYAEDEKIKGVEKLLAYRLMKRDYMHAAEKAAAERGKRMKIILDKYTTYKATNNKAPASLADLQLPEDCKQFVNSKGEKVDWIYIGHLGPRLKTNSTHVVLAEPEPLGDARVCGLDNGEIVRFNNGSVEGHINKLVEAMKKVSAKPNGVNNETSASSPALVAIMKKMALYKDLNNEKLPTSLKELELDEAHKLYTDPVTGEKSAWLYLGNKSKIRVNKELKVIILAPKPHQGRRLAGLSNGKVAALNEKQIAPLLK